MTRPPSSLPPPLSPSSQKPFPLLSFTKISMESNEEVQLEFSPFLRVYKSGRFERPLNIPNVPASFDPSTNVTSKDVLIEPETNVWARLYLPNLSNHHPCKKLPLLIYFHGGGFFSSSAGSPWYHTYLNSLASKGNVLAVSVDYRIAPEHLLPTAYDDSWTALMWVASHSEDSGTEEWLKDYADFSKVFFAGDSAGANIAHNMAMRASEARLSHGMEIEGMVLIHPYFWGTKRLGSETEEDEKRFLRFASVDAQWLFLCPDTSGNDDPRINPVAEGSPSLAKLGCKRVFVCVAEKDLLRDRGRVYCQGLRKSGWGGEVELVETEGEDHGFYFPKFDSERALDLMHSVVCFVNEE